LDVVFVGDGVDLHEGGWEVGGGDVGGEGGGEAEVVEVVDEDFEGGRVVVGEVYGGTGRFLWVVVSQSVTAENVFVSSSKGLGMSNKDGWMRYFLFLFALLP
jgi:hypothetical protein